MAIAPRLARILADYRTRAAALAQADPPYPHRGVESLFDDTERELLAALDGHELIAMRDFVTDLFARARAALDAKSVVGAAVYGEGEARRVLPAVFGRMAAAARPAQHRGHPDREASATWIERVGNAIERIWMLAEKDNLQVDLCVKSTPPEARFFMHPRSYPEGPPTLSTNGRLSQAWRGLYVYTVDKQGFKEIGNELDLVTDLRQVVTCRLVAVTAAEEVQLCRRQAGTIEECPQ